MAEHYGNTPRITYEFPDCSMPMAFDTYNNCSFGCIKLDAEIFLRAKLDKAMNMGTREKSSKYYTMSAADYMKWCWNNPQAAHSPYKMFEGAMLPADERDSEGNIVYKYNGAKF